MGTQQKKKKRTRDTRSITSEIKRAQDLDSNRLALQPSFEGTAYMTGGVNVIEFVNVRTTIHTSQTNAPQAPGQVAGLTVTVAGDTQLNLSWTATATATSYNVYQSQVSGSGFATIANPTTNSFINTGLQPGTTYYYKVSANNANGEGPQSAQGQATTTGTPPSILPSLWLAFNNSLIDSSPNGNTVTFVPTGGNVIYGTPGKFGSHFAITNYPTMTTLDAIKVSASTSTALDLTSIGFSISFWLWVPGDSSLGVSTGNAFIMSKSTDLNNWLMFTYRSSDGFLYIEVKKAGTTYVRKSSAQLSSALWHHIVITFNGSTSNLELYFNKVEGVSGTASGFSVGSSPPTEFWIGNMSGNSNTGSTYRGRIDEFQYFKGRVLTQTQVNNLFNTNAP